MSRTAHNAGSTRPSASAVAATLVAGLGAVAVLRRGLEERDERRGLVDRLGPDGTGELPEAGLGRRIAQWDPGRPEDPRVRILATAWAAPASIVGLVVALAGRGELAWDDRVGAWVATDVGGPSRILLRRAGMAANTLGHVVVCINDTASQRLLDHEAVHVRQFERLGLLMYPLYLWLSARHGYRDNPLEVGARRGAARRAALRHPIDPGALGPG